MNISMIGSGTVGIAVGLGFAQHGHHVTFYDIDKYKLRELERTFKNVQIDFATELSTIVKTTSISFLCLPTPTINGLQDISAITGCLKEIVNLSKDVEINNDFIVVLKSTIIPGTSRRVCIPLLRRANIRYCFNPEFLREKYALEDFLSPDRIVLGVDDQETGKVMFDLHRSFNRPIFLTDPTTAEVIKYVSNYALASRISFFNEMKKVCDFIGVDSNYVSKIVGLDSRIGPYGTVPGRPYGGSCLPKDTEAFLRFCEDLGLDVKLLRAVHEVNEEMKMHIMHIPTRVHNHND